MKIHVLKLNFFLLFILFSLFVSAQEICNNGIDDDGDNYIDLADNECGGNSAQCNGSLNTVINVDFGTGTGLGPPLSTILPGSTIGYTYQSTLGAANTYTIRNNPMQAHSAAWFNTTDHTPNDINGRMLILNGSTSSNNPDYFRYNIALCPNTKYDFSIWAANILNAPMFMSGPFPKYGADCPNISILIEVNGSVIAGKNTGWLPNTPSILWANHGFSFTTPANVSSITLVLRSNGIASFGNDFAIDDITFSVCGPLFSIVGINNSCNDFFLDGNIGLGYTTPVFQWQESNDSINFSPIIGAMSEDHTILNPSNSLHYYQLIAAENGNINNPNCRTVSNIQKLDCSPPLAVDCYQFDYNLIQDGVKLHWNTLEDNSIKGYVTSKK